MKISPDKAIVSKYITADEYEYVFGLLIEGDIDDEINSDDYKRLKEAAYSKRLCDDAFILMQHARLSFLHSGPFSIKQREDRRLLQNDLRGVGDVAKLRIEDLQGIIFTIKGRKIYCNDLEVQLALHEILARIQREDIQPSPKKRTKPTKPESEFIQALVPLAKFLKFEHDFTNAEVYRFIQVILFADGYDDADEEFIRLRLQANLKNS